MSDEEFFYPKSDKECTINYLFNFIKKNRILNQHQDPVDYHQKYLMIMTFRKRGRFSKRRFVFSN